MIPTMMRAAVCRGRRDLRIELVPTPKPSEGELLLRVRAAGVCGTDAQEWASGPNVYATHGRHPVTGHEGPLIPGHELAGEVVDRGAGAEGFALGALVACGAGFTLGSDRQTVAGRPHLSSRYATIGLQANGGFAQYCTVPARACLPAQGLPPDALALAQPAAIAIHAVRRGRLQPGERVVVIGVGGIGAFVVAAAVRHGARVTAIDRDDRRLRVASSLGATETLDAHATSMEEVADVIVEATGSPSGLAIAMRMASPACRIVVVGLQAQLGSVDLRVLSQREHELIGSNAHHGEVDLPESLRLLASRPRGWHEIAPLAIPLDQIVSHGIQPLLGGGMPHVKTLVDPWQQNSRPTDTVPRHG